MADQRVEDSVLYRAANGAAMDTVIVRSRRPYFIKIGLGLLAVIAGGAALYAFLPSGLQVQRSDVRIAAVESGVFRDEIVVRSSAAALNTVVLDASESGRVEEVLVRDGAMVEKGQLLFRLSNPQRRIDLLARESDYTQQISNLSNLRVTLAMGESEHLRRMSQAVYDLEIARKAAQRTAALAEKGFVAASALDEARDRLTLAQSNVKNERASYTAEQGSKLDAVKQMEKAITVLDRGLELLHATVEALSVRAPMAGRVTGMNLEVGEMVQADQHIGRIDDPTRVKLLGEIDEYYSGRVKAGRSGSALVGRKRYPITVSRILPQIKNGRFQVELIFDGEAPALSPGQGVEVQLVLGEATRALVLPASQFLNDTGGNWVFVLDKSGDQASRRDIRIGRRSSSQVEVVAGLSPGERVIISSYGPFLKAERLQLD